MSGLRSDDNQNIILKYYIVKLRVTIKMGKQNILLKYQPVSKLETIICDLTSSFCYNFACHARVRPFRTFLFDPIEIQTPHLIVLCLVQVLTPNKKLIFSITNTNFMLYLPVKSNSLYSRDTILQAFTKNIRSMSIPNQQILYLHG